MDHSVTELTWTAHVGRDNALAGSRWSPSDATGSNAAVAAESANAPPPATATRVASASAGGMGESRGDDAASGAESSAPSAPSADSADSASAAANPKAKRKLLTVRRLSDVPWRMSTLARMSPYLVLAAMPAGMVAKTKARRNRAPKLDAGGVRAAGQPRNQR